MRKAAIALLALAFLATAFHAGAEYDVLETTARVTKATVFRSAALVTRTVDVELPAGVTVVKVTDLPPNVEPTNTVVEGSGDFTILADEIRDTWVEKAAGEEVKELSARLEELDKEIAELDVRIDEAVKRAELYRRMTPSFPKEGDKTFDTLTAEDCKRLLDTAESGMRSALQEAIELKGKRKKAADERDAVRKRLKQLGGKRRTKTVLVTVKAARAGKGTLRIVSLSGDCRWTSSYDARLVNETTCEVSYYADVTQRSGEEWKGVRLTLSTADVASLVLPPVLKKWALNLREAAKKGVTAAPRAPAANAAKFDRTAKPWGGGERGGRVADTAAREGGGGVVVEFDVPGTADIPPAATRRLLVKKLTFTGKLEREVMPRVQPYAFAVMETTNDSEYPLLPGEMRVFTGNELIGSRSFPLVMQGAKMKLYFGADPAIEVKYRPVKHKEDKGRKTREIEFEWIMEITNHRSEAVAVKVIDALPRPAMDEIRVRSVKIRPRPDNDYEEDPYRLVKWSVTLQPSEKKVFTVSFKLTAPSDIELSWQGPWAGGVR